MRLGVPELRGIAARGVDEHNGKRCDGERHPHHADGKHNKAEGVVEPRDAPLRAA